VKNKLIERSRQLVHRNQRLRKWVAIIAILATGAAQALLFVFDAE